MSREGSFEDKFLLALVIVVSLAFLWVALPFYGSILWGVIMAILFAPYYRRVRDMLGGRANLAALVSVLTILFIVVTPALLLSAMLIDELSRVYDELQAGQIDLGLSVVQLKAMMPHWMSDIFDRFGFGSLVSVRDKIEQGILKALQLIADQALNIGTGALSLLVGMGVMLYLTYFLLRDGDKLKEQLENSVPLRARQRRALFDKFITVVLATIKGSVIVAVAQGTLGGLVFWALDLHAPVLWGVAMGFFSLLPAVGTGIIWVPVAIYLLVTGAVWKGMILVFCGLFLIGTIDNILRPLLVGKETRLPDYVVLISTLGGISVFGFHGFVLGPVIAALFISAWDIMSRTWMHPETHHDTVHH